ncbi:hypothetical protein, partial [Streptomyces massasporeus]|uniref:hypothetical protein n=1 Tax=Streptomyces massasporeus TaxID=67324 RepID=UPI00331D27C5
MGTARGRGLHSRAGAAPFSSRETPVRHRAAPRGARPGGNARARAGTPARRAALHGAARGYFPRG